MKRSLYFIVLFSGTALLLFYLIYPMFLGQLYPVGDIAADMLLANKISDEGYLLNGHYSRWQFHHPGPFFSYVNYFSETLFGWLPISRLQTWQLGSIFLNTTFLVYSALSFSKYLEVRHKNIFSCLLILVTIGCIGFGIADLWMPNRLFTPYLAFFVSLLHLSKGNFKYLVPATFCTGILIHGYATMPFFTIPFLIIGTVLGCFLNNGLLGLYSHYKYFVVSFLISLIFVSPIIVDHFIQDPSNLSLLLKVNSNFASMPKASVEEIRDVVLNLFFKGREDLWLVFFLVIIPVIIFVKNSRKEEERSVITVIALTALILTVGILYYSTTPAPVYVFTMQFLKVLIPLLFSLPLFLVINDIALSRLKFSRYINRHRIVSLSLSTLLIVISVTHIARAGPKQPNLFIHIISEEIISRLNSKSKSKVILDYSRHTQWGIIAGLMLELRSSGVDSCTVWKHMAFLYTHKHVCDFDNSALPVRIVPSDLCDNSCDFILNSIGLQFDNQFLVNKDGHASRLIKHGLKNLKPISPSDVINHRLSILVHSGWSGAESTHRWSDSKLAHISFKIDASQDFEGFLRLHLGTLGRQKITISIEGTDIYSEVLETSDKILDIPFDKTLLKNGMNTFAFALPDARQPGNGDLRTLSLALKSFQIR